MKPVYFASPADLRRWLEQHHATEAELLVGFHKVHTGRAGLTYKQTVDEALCFGWIDGVRRGVDSDRYTVRLTPRKPGSHWSRVNLTRIAELIAEGRVNEPGMRAYESREPEKSAQYSYENAPRELAPEYAQRLLANANAARFFAAQPPSYQRVASFWVMSAKKEETRLSRLATLIEVSARDEWIPQMRWSGRGPAPASGKAAKETPRRRAASRRS